MIWILNKIKKLNYFEYIFVWRSLWISVINVSGWEFKTTYVRKELIIRSSLGGGGEGESLQHLMLAQIEAHFVAQLSQPINIFWCSPNEIYIQASNPPSPTYHIIKKKKKMKFMPKYIYIYKAL